MEPSPLLLDYRVRPAEPDATVASVTNQLARWLPSTAGRSALAGWGHADWLAAEWVTYWQNALPWLVRRIQDSGAEPSADVYARLRILDRDIRERTRRMLANAVELLAALHEEGVDAVPLKGAVLAPRYYPDPLLRPLTDLDILVRERDLVRAGAILSKLDYRLHSRSAEDVVYIRGEFRGHGWSPDNVHPVEMHYAVREEYAGLAFDLSDTIWRSSARSAYWHGIDALVPDTPVLLLHVCAHATSDWLIRRGRLYQIGDLQLISRRMTPDDWDVFGAAIGPDNSRYVYPALAFALKYTDLPVPVGLLERLQALTPVRMRAYVDATELAEASQSNSETRSGIGLGIAQMLARSRRERVLMWLRSLFPRRWNLAHRYPRLAATPFWPLCYAIINGDRLWHVLRAKVVSE
jgi:hypothetical protein